jgi:hypothetical protein
VVPNDFVYHKRQKPLGKIWVKPTGNGKLPQSTHLFDFPLTILRRKSVPRLQLADRMSGPEPLGQHVDDGRINIINAVPQLVQTGKDISSLHRHVPSSSTAGRPGKPKSRQAFSAENYGYKNISKCEDTVTAEALRGDVMRPAIHHQLNGVPLSWERRREWAISRCKAG